MTLCVRPSVRASVRPSVNADISDMPGPISFKLCTRITVYDIHMHIDLFRDPIKNGRQAAILDRITKLIDVHLYAIGYYPCAKFERN